MTIKDIIFNPSQMGDDESIYAQKTNGHFSGDSIVVIPDLTDEEKNMLTYEISKLKCPGFEYFLESFMIKDMVNELKGKQLKEQIDIIVHYAEYDA